MTHLQPLRRLRHGLLVSGQWSVVLALFCVPLSKAATSTCIVLALFSALTGAELRQRWRQALHDPVARGMLVWAGLMMASALHSWLSSQDSAPLRSSDVWTFTMPAVIASLLLTPQLRWRAWKAFALGIGMVLLISLLMAIGLVPQRAVAELIVSMRNSVFKEYTQQGLATLMLATLLLSVLPTLPRRGWRLAAGAIAGLAVFNVSFLLGSRTSYLTLSPLLLYWLWVWLRDHLTRGRILLVMAGTSVLLATTILTAPTTGGRLHAISSEISGHMDDGQATSTGIRLWLWQHTVSIARESLLIGHGLGQWEPRYVQRMAQIPDSTAYLTGHPHQEMLLILAEEGVIGLLALLVLLALLARLCRQLPASEQHFVYSLLIIYMSAGQANGLLADFTHRNTFILLLSCIPSVASMASIRPPLRSHS